MKLFILLLLVSLAILAMAKPSFPQQLGAGTPLEVFQSRSGWKNLSPNYITALANRFSSTEDAVAFAQLCETSGILKNNIVQLSRFSPDFAISNTATTLTSYGNTLGAQGNLDTAIQAYKYAIALNPNFVPAYLGLSTAHREKREFDRAIQALRSAPSTHIMGKDSLDFSFELAFYEVSVLIAKLQIQSSESDRRALVAKLHEAKALGQQPVSKGMIWGAGIHGWDPVADRREKLQLIEGLLKELAP